MAEDSDLEKTESASARRLEQAREEGQVPHSRELATFISLMVGVAALYVLGRWGGHRMMELVRSGLNFERQKAFEPEGMQQVLAQLATDGLLTIAPLLLASVVAALVTPFLMGGWVFSTSALKFDLTRLDPLQGLGRMFSTHGLAELVKATLKSVLVASVGVWVVWRERDHLFSLMLQPLATSMDDFASLVLLSALLIVGSLAVIAAIDVPFQLWEYHRRLRMTKDELRQEMKEQEGDPQIKARIRAAQREMSRRRMMSNVPTADVVVTNPTHYAVALKYDPDRAGAPIVVAKGADVVAGKIRELAREHNVPILEAPPLARALFAHCELEQQIPAALYTVVAEVMAWVFQLNHWIAEGGLPPDVPGALAVPEGMDPGPGEPAP
ncbi:flagellar biosynthesis protein FlhB [Zoogloea oryzae]|uniref:Flagellar biosynthetic protein FlhB n=1 Tax=Zoogloea oryzae TaxID=310767 RepID=A0ABQ6FDB0_9RHOO|nr:flagellar biosynthesis protein FlhB [Zoogloea oryzae]GLT23608.1 flagellar biosynthesis protein FlhB [Zoogloea oryzae]